MATLTTFLDTRVKRKSGQYPLYISVSATRAIVLTIPLNIRLAQENWDPAFRRVIRHKYQSIYNMAIQEQMLNLERKLIQLEISKQIDNMQSHEVKAYLMASDQLKQPAQQNFIEYYQSYITNIRRQTTRNIHTHTLKKIQQYDNSQPSLENIDKTWVKGFERHLFLQHLDSRAHQIPGIRQLSPNGISLHLRNLRKICNEAIECGVVDSSWYPFRKYELPAEEPPKLTLPVTDLRIIRDFPAEEYCHRYLDVFMLSFYLIGINIGDLLLLRPGDLVAGRIEFNRQKTAKRYSIKVEPEAMEIINRWRGQKYLLCFMDKLTDYKTFLHKMNKYLKEFGPVQILKHGKKKKQGLYPYLRSYYARDTWATIASILDIPEDTIAAALGHGKKTVTKGYISFSTRKVDIANRMVLDYTASSMTDDEILEINARQTYNMLSFTAKFGSKEDAVLEKMPISNR